jgi:hypothetical protein
MFIKQSLGRDHETGSAKAALLRVVVYEGLLNRVQLGTIRKALNRRDLVALRLDGEHHATLNRFAIEQHGTGTALTRLTANVGPGQTKLIPKKLDQQRSWLGLSGSLFPIDRQRHGHLGRHRCCRTFRDARHVIPPPLHGASRTFPW